MLKFYLYLIISLHTYQIFAQERLSSIEGISTGSLPYSFVETSNKVYFKATHEYSGRELYYFDKNNKIVKIVGDFFEGPNSTFDNYFPWTLGRVGEFNLVNFRDKVYFLGKNKSIYDIPLIYETNGETTQVRKDLSELIKGNPLQIYKTDSLLLFFVLNSEYNSIGIWKSDGTINGTKSVAEFPIEGSPFYPPNVSNVKINGSFISFSPSTFLNYNNKVEYLLDLNTNLLQKRDSENSDNIASFKAENGYLTYKLDQDSLKFTKTDFQKSKVLNRGVFVGNYFQLSNIKILQSDDPNILYTIHRESYIYKLYKINLLSEDISFVKEINPESNNAMPFSKILANKLIYADFESKNSETTTSLKSLDLKTLQVKTLKSWYQNNSVPLKVDKLMDFDFDRPPVFVGTESSVIFNLKIYDVKNSFQSYTESWQIDINDGKANKIENFVLSSTESVKISDENILVLGSSDSLLLSSEPFLINIHNAKATQVAKINKGKNFFNSVNLEKYVVFWRKNKDGGTDIFSSDGSKVGTRLIRKIDKMSVSGSIVINNHLFFVVERNIDNNNYSKLLQMYVTDGTISNTFIIDESNSYSFRLFAYKNKCYFRPSDVYGRGKFVISDGIKQNTKFVDNPFSDPISNIYPSENQDYLYFTTNRSANNGKSYIASLHKITDIDQTPILLFTKEIILNGEMYGFGLKNVFRNPIVLNIRENDYQILNKDGTEIKIISNDSSNLIHYKDYVVGKFSFLYFKDKKSQSDFIWQTDGTIEGTKMVANPKMLKILFTNNRSYNDYDVSPERDVVYVNQNDETEKWLTDGSEENTFLIEDERDIYKLYPTKKAFIAPANNLYNYALWVSNGSRESTYKKIDSLSNEAYYGLWLETNNFIGVRKKGSFLLFDIKNDTLYSFFPINISKYHTPSNLTVIGNNLLFFGTDKEISTQLWRFYIDEVKGIKEEKILEKLSINVFPNPTDNELLIDYTPKNEVIQIMISDLTGNVIKTQEFKTPFVEQMPIYLSEFPTGIYILYLKDGVEMISKRIVKF